MPEFIFDRWWDALPNLKRLASQGIHGRLRSTIPPITVPAWTCMMTSQDPGMLGIYGFRNRKSYDYEDLIIANASAVTARTLWSVLSRNRLRSLVVGVPQTYPPKPLNGIMVADFMTPNKDAPYTYPPEVQAELNKAAGGEYIIDVSEFRTDNKKELLEEIYLMTRARFRAFRHFLRKEDFDFAIAVEMGIDRIHHGFWRYCDPTHRLYEPGNPFEHAIRDYYVYVDEEIGETLEALDPGSSVMVVSDHGAKKMVGAICINEWLQREGYLVLREQPPSRQLLKRDMIDWSRSAAWGEGGYYGRIYMNVRGREPEGVILAGGYEDARDELKRRLESMRDEEGNLLGTRAFRPEEVYRQCRNIPPDLIVYIGDLDWRSAASVGVGSIYMYENDTGPDDANHSEDGILIWAAPDEKGFRQSQQLYSIYDVAPSILHYFGLEAPPEMIGKPLATR